MEGHTTDPALLPKLSIPMQLAYVVVRTDQRMQVHCEAMANN